MLSDPVLRPAARWWRRVTEEAFGIDLVPVTEGPADVVLALAPDLPAGGYRIEVDEAASGAVVRVEAADLAGAHAAAQTLRQLAGPSAYRRAPADYRGASTLPALPAVRVEDHPRFAWRGVLLDVARHFLPKADVLRFVDLAAAHRLNVLQLHLTDDQGWRVQVHRYPELTRTGAWRRESTVGTWRTGSRDGRPHGGFYTQDDLREIVAYARDRGITVVPEIDVPGHVEAAVAAYPELGTRKDRSGVRTTWGISQDVLDPSEGSLAFFRHVLDEVLEVFDSPWIGLGGDEVPPTLWRESPAVVERARSLGLFGPDGAVDVAQLHGWFVARLAEHASAAGRRAVVWDEAVSPMLPRDVIVTSWRGYAQGAAALAAGYDVVMAPEQVLYLDHRAGDHPAEPIPVGFLRTVEDVYSFDPLPPGLIEAQSLVEPQSLVDPRWGGLGPTTAGAAARGTGPGMDRAPGQRAARRLRGVPAAGRVRRGRLVAAGRAGARVGGVEGVPGAPRTAPPPAARRVRRRVPAARRPAPLADAARRPGVPAGPRGGDRRRRLGGARRLAGGRRRREPARARAGRGCGR